MASAITCGCCVSRMRIRDKLSVSDKLPTQPIVRDHSANSPLDQQSMPGLRPELLHLWPPVFKSSCSFSVPLPRHSHFLRINDDHKITHIDVGVKIISLCRAISWRPLARPGPTPGPAHRSATIYAIRRRLWQKKFSSGQKRHENYGTCHRVSNFRLRSAWSSSVCFARSPPAALLQGKTKACRPVPLFGR